MDLEKVNTEKQTLLIIALIIALWRCCMFNQSATRKYCLGGITTARQLSPQQRQRILEVMLSIL